MLIKAKPDQSSRSSGIKQLSLYRLCEKERLKKGRSENSVFEFDTTMWFWECPLSYIESSFVQHTGAGYLNVKVSGPRRVSRPLKTCTTKCWACWQEQKVALAQLQSLVMMWKYEFITIYKHYVHKVRDSQRLNLEEGDAMNLTPRGTNQKFYIKIYRLAQQLCLISWYSRGKKCAMLERTNKHCDSKKLIGNPKKGIATFAQAWCKQPYPLQAHLCSAKCLETSFPPIRPR